MISSLPMYKRPELEGAHNRYWALIRDCLRDDGIECPDRLSQDRDRYEVWNDPALVLSQTCGRPYRTRLHGRVTLVGTPDFGVEDCAPGYYCSVFVVRKSDTREHLSDFQNARFAYNGEDSQSGYAAPYFEARKSGFWFENRLCSGLHLNSARMVADSNSDIAALDAVTWRQIRTYEAFSNQLRVLCRTEPTPGLPYIAASPCNREAIFTAVENAISALSRDDRESLGLKGLVSISERDYLAVPNPP